MKASDHIAEVLAAQGVTHVFELVGGMITHLIDSISMLRKSQLVSMHHEQAAAFAADAYGRMAGIPGVAMATSGPGATNLLTGIGSAHFDSSPSVFLTGQVNRDEQKGTRAIRQLGFQETDIVSMAAPITKLALGVNSAEELSAVVHRAFLVALSGRPGPVLVDLPMDLQRVDITAPAVRMERDTPAPVGEREMDELFRALSLAERPLILAGGGMRSARAVAAFRRVLARVRIPVVHSLMGVDVLPYAHPQRVGLIGSYGNRWANIAIAKSDLLVVLGSRLDVRQTGARVDSFREGRAIFHVDCEPGEMNNRVTGCRAIHADLREFLNAFAEFVERRPGINRPEWRREISISQIDWPDTAELLDFPGINPNEFMHQLSAAANGASSFVADVGQHQMWAAQSLELGPDQRFLTSGGMGAMGFALPAAIGAACACPGRPVVMIAGDGGFQLNLQELQTVVRLGLPIKMVVIDNGCHGMVRQFQQSYFHERYSSTLWGYSAPDFAAVARAYGIASASVEHPAAVAAGIDELFRDPHAPGLLVVKVDTFANAYPKLAFGKPITEMEPQAVPLGMEST